PDPRGRRWGLAGAERLHGPHQGPRQPEHAQDRVRCHAASPHARVSQDGAGRQAAQAKPYPGARGSLEMDDESFGGGPDSRRRPVASGDRYAHERAERPHVAW
ncbi:unnamed protein product, partial [Ectocarpus sp. 12 AP-2014]